MHEMECREIRATREVGEIGARPVSQSNLRWPVRDVSLPLGYLFSLTPLVR